MQCRGGGAQRGGAMNDDWGGCGCGDNDKAASVSTYGLDLAHLAHPLPHPCKHPHGRMTGFHPVWYDMWQTSTNPKAS